MASNNMYGVITIDGKNYVERWQILPFDLTISGATYVNTSIQINFPGGYDFRMKALTRSVTNSSGADVTAASRFKCRIGNSDGGVWYSQGIGGNTDRVIDTLMFGNAAFPYVIIPSLYYTKNGAILMELETVTNMDTQIIHFAFHGSYLIPIG